MDQGQLRAFNESGFVLLRNFFPAEAVDQVWRDAARVFHSVLTRRDWTTESQLTRATLEQGMIRLFNENAQEFMNCGKQIQHLISLHRLALDQRIETTLRNLGLAFPNISTRPVLFFNHPQLAKKEVYWKVAAHQDWRSMQGSLNAVVVWLPLVPIDRDLGALQVVPGSHREGLLTSRVEDGFGMVDRYTCEDFVSVEMQLGDALFFSSFLVHRSGENVTEKVRWSCHFRYNDLEEPTFIERGFPHPYLYKPQEELLTPNFPSVEAVREVYPEACESAMATSS
jgi:phytanoyl-CoA hydroxylase